jgi:hypothetical protein
VYEIYYEPKGNVWRIRVTVYYFLFFALSTTVCEAQHGEGKGARLVPMNFGTYDLAKRHTTAVGLDNMYVERRRVDRAVWTESAAHVQSIAH